MENTRSVPEKVLRAKLEGDKQMLSEFARRGVASLKRKKEKEKARLAFQFQGSEEMRLQANEDICPID